MYYKYTTNLLQEGDTNLLQIYYLLQIYKSIKNGGPIVFFFFLPHLLKKRGKAFFYSVKGVRGRGGGLKKNGGPIFFLLCKRGTGAGTG